MDIYGLIGKPLQHSFSGDYFSAKFAKKHIDAEYRLWEMDELPDLHEFARQYPRLRGMNVTIPYKRKVLPELDEVCNNIHLVGSVNVIKVRRSGEDVLLKGYNTDVIGFEKSLKPLVKGRKNLRALILGTGGSSHSVAYVLRKLGIYFSFVTRHPEKLETMGYSWINSAVMQEFQLIINTTPVGMFPETDKAPVIPYEMLTHDHILFDLIYNPEETLFLKRGRAQGAQVKNGLEMLKIQAEESWKIWNKR